MTGEHYKFIKELRDHAELEAAQLVISEVSPEEGRLLRDQAQGLVYDIFNDFLSNDPKFSNFPYRTVDVKHVGRNKNNTVDLTQLRMRWGNKFEPTAEEEIILKRYVVEVLNPELSIPSVIEREDYKATHWVDVSAEEGVVVRHASMEVYHPERSSWLTITHETFDPVKLIKIPEIIYPAIIRLANNELHTKTRLYSGRDYWKSRQGSKVASI